MKSLLNVKSNWSVFVRHVFCSTKTSNSRFKYSGSFYGVYRGQLSIKSGHPYFVDCPAPQYEYSKSSSLSNLCSFKCQKYNDIKIRYMFSLYLQSPKKTSSPHHKVKASCKFSTNTPTNTFQIILLPRIHPIIRQMQQSPIIKATKCRSPLKILKKDELRMKSPYPEA